MRIFTGSLPTVVALVFGKSVDGSFATLTYDFDEVVRTLESVASYDWAAFLNLEPVSGTRPRLNEIYAPRSSMDES